jgi:cell division protein FtsN
MLCVLFTPCARAEDNEYFAKGKNYFQSGQYFFATTWLERFLHGYPASPLRKEALIIITKAYSLSDRKEKAASSRETLKSEFPDAADSIDIKEPAKAEPVPVPVPVPALVPVPAPAPVPVPAPDVSAPQPTLPSAFSSYTLQAGVSVNRSKLNKQMKELKSAGFQPVMQKMSTTMNVFRLVTESFATEATAQNHLDVISPLVKSAFIAKCDGKYCVVAASFFSNDAALTERNKLAQKKLPSEIVTSQVTMTVWQLTVGNFSDRQQAENSLKILTDRGIDTIVVPR